MIVNQGDFKHFKFDRWCWLRNGLILSNISRRFTLYGMFHSFLSIILMAFGSGFSLLFSSQILITWILDSGGSIEQVGLVGLLTFPYLCSFLWMPGLDYLSRYFSRQYMISFGFFALSGCLLSSAYLDPVMQYKYVLMLGFLMALICSTNDHVIEAYRVKILQENEYKLGVTLSLMAFRLGIMLAGGVGLIYAASFSWQRMYQQAAFIVLSLAISVLFAPTEEKSEQNSLSFHFNMSWNFLKALLNEYHFVGVLSTYRLSVFWLELMMPALLMQFLQLSVFDLGVLYKFYGVIGLLTGGVAVNLFVDQSKIVKALFISLIAQIGVCGLFFLISFFPNVSYEIIGVVVFIECFLQGVLGTVSTIWLMQKTRSDLPAFSFSVWHGLSALGRVWIGPIAAIIIGDFGWRYFTAVGVLLAILSVIICQYHLSMLHQDSHH